MNPNIKKVWNALMFFVSAYLYSGLFAGGLLMLLVTTERVDIFFKVLSIHPPIKIAQVYWVFGCAFMLGLNSLISLPKHFWDEYWGLGK